MVQDLSYNLCESLVENIDGVAGIGKKTPTPITYLTQWKIVGNSEVHTDPYLTQWKVSGNSVVQDGVIMSCGDYSDVDGKYHVKISNGVTIFDIPLDAPLRKVNDVADTIEFPSGTEGRAMVTRNVESKTVSAYNDADGNQIGTTLPDDTILHIQNLYDYTQATKINVSFNNVSQRNAEIKIVQTTGASYLGFSMPLQDGKYYSSCLFKNEDAKPNIIYSNSGDGSKINSSNYQKTSLLQSNVTTFRYSALNNPAGVWELNDMFFVKDINIFDIDAMFADCTDLKPASNTAFETLFPNLGCIDRINTAIDVIVKDGKLYKDDETGIEILVPLTTPTTELVDAPQIAVSPTDTYTSANTTPYSAFEYKKNVEIWSCGEYNPIDGKYHILVQPLGGSIADIALNEPLRKVNDVSDTIEFPSGTEGKALVTRKNIFIQKSFNNGYFDSSGTVFISAHISNDIVNLTYGDKFTISICNKLETNYIAAMQNANMVAIGTYGRAAIFRNYEIEQTVDAYKAWLDTLGELDLICQLTTPTTELVDAPQIQEAENYSCVISQGGKAVVWSSFETE